MVCSAMLTAQTAPLLGGLNVSSSTLLWRLPMVSCLMLCISQCVSVAFFKFQAISDDSLASFREKKGDSSAEDSDGSPRNGPSYMRPTTASKTGKGGSRRGSPDVYTPGSHRRSPSRWAHHKHAASPCNEAYEDCCNMHSARHLEME